LSAREIAAPISEPPHSRTRAKLQTAESETASVVRSWPMFTTVVAASGWASSSTATGSLTARRSANAFEVDPGQVELRGVGCCEVALDRVAVGDDEQDLARDRTVVVGLGREHVVVDHRLVERHGKHLVGAEPDRVLELLLVVDAGDLDHADADAAVREAEPHVAARQRVGREELCQRLAERSGIANLAAVDDARAGATWRAIRTTCLPPLLTIWQPRYRSRRPSGRRSRSCRRSFPSLPSWP
jgi:hypothetical protein